MKSRTVINATGVFADRVQAMDEADHQPTLRPSQGIHLVVSNTFLPGNTAIMIPRTSDGRVLFAVPWHGSVVLGTTDTAVDQITEEPVALQHEIDFILADAGKYLRQPPGLHDIRSIYAGLRPLVSGNKKKTAALSRDHVILVSQSGMISITGGKWTTYRKMAEEVLDLAITRMGLKPLQCRTQDLPIMGQHEESIPASLENLDEQQLHQHIHRSVTQEMCLTVEDFLSRRSRQLILDAQKAIDLSPLVAKFLSSILKRNAQWETGQINNFKQVASNYLPN